MGRYSFEGIIASVLFVFLFCIILVQVVGRTPIFTGPVWTEEAARWLWVWMAFVGIAEAERTDTQLRMGFLADMLPRGMRRIMFTLIDLAYLGIVGHLSWIGYKTVMRTANNTSVTLPTTDAVLYGSAFVAFVLVLHRIVRRIFGRFGAGREATS